MTKDEFKLYFKLNPRLPMQLSMILCCSLFFIACKRDEITNPYANIVNTVQNDNPSMTEMPEGSFAWLHAKVFRPTCANSGCHDGTFEPEFKSIYGAYNSLVNHPVINNTPDDAFEFRVVPGNAEASFLHERLTAFVPFTSGIMPLALSDGSDWGTQGDFYIQKITDWINAGARDPFGQVAPATTADSPPLVYGLVVFPHNNTTTPYTREADPPYGIGAIEVPSDLVDVWIYPYDDLASPNLFESISLLASTSSTDFTNSLSATFGLNSPVYSYLFDSQDPVPFVYKATLDLSGGTPGQYYYLRNYLDDGVQPGLTEIPNSESSPLWFLIFSLKVIS